MRGTDFWLFGGLSQLQSVIQSFQLEFNSSPLAPSCFVKIILVFGSQSAAISAKIGMLMWRDCVWQGIGASIAMLTSLMPRELNNSMIDNFLGTFCIEMSMSVMWDKNFRFQCCCLNVIFVTGVKDE